MAHPAQSEFLAFVKTKFVEYFCETDVVEVGSLNINGSCRDFFHNPTMYVGIDLGEGAGVTWVGSGHEFDQSLGAWDVVISAEMFEHNKYWKETWVRMVELARPGGLVVFTCATTGRAEHGTRKSGLRNAPFLEGKWEDYYKNLTEDDFRGIMDFDEHFSQHQFSTHESANDLYFYGIKKEG